MRQRSFILVATAIFLLLVGSVGVYAYDASRDDLIADGVVVGGVDVGGMRASEARVTIENQLAAPLRRSLTVTYREHSFELPAERARIRADVEGMVQEALEASRDGHLVTRVVRDMTGGAVRASLPSRVSYSRAAVDRLVRRIKRRIDRKAESARVSYSAAGLSKVPSKAGLAIRGHELRRLIEQELVRPDGTRTVAARAKVTRPKVTTGQLADRNPYFIVVNRTNFTLRFYKRLRLAKIYRVAVGAVGFDTPTGLYHIQNKGVNVAWNVPDKPWAGKLRGKTIPGGRADNPLKARWMGIYDGAGIHGTDAVSSLGSRASHGCIRMAIPDVIQLYDQVPLQTPVYIS